jgi:hypothetical protein
MKKHTPSVPKKASLLCLDTKVYRHVLAIDSSVSRKSCEAFLGTEGVYKRSIWTSKVVLSFEFSSIIFP